MHEAGIARSIVTAIRDNGLVGVPVRVVVTGGHDAPDDFDASLRFHLSIAAVDIELGPVEIVHRPGPRWCPACGRPSIGLVDASCPDCGGPTMGTPSEEAIELEWGEMPGTSDPAVGDRGPSAGGAPGAQAGVMRSNVPAAPADPPADGDRRRPDARDP
jgi:Zn finger protein HypA/HybF involved in hydrogenase expression